MIGQSHAEIYHNLEKALENSKNVTILSITEYDEEVIHLPKTIESLSNLKELDISCNERLEDLPKEIGKLSKLEKIISNNGNGCAMNLKIPDEIGMLKNLKVLELYGALDARHPSITKTQLGVVSPLPKTIGKLRGLQELNLGRNGLPFVPTAVSSLEGGALKKLNLEYNNLSKVPAFLGELDKLEQLNLDYNRKIQVIPDEFGNLNRLKLLSIRGNLITELPQSLGNIRGLTIEMGNNSLTLRQQRALHKKFPSINLSFTNDEDDNQNEISNKRH
jgi:Leucine-rich repeat (LRR) protein